MQKWLLSTNELGVVTCLLKYVWVFQVSRSPVLADGSLDGQRGSDCPLLTPLLRRVKVALDRWARHWRSTEQGTLGPNWEQGGVSGEASKTSRQGQGGLEAVVSTETWSLAH